MPTRWLLAVNADSEDAPAVAFAQWLRQAVGSDAEFVPCHVLESQWRFWHEAGASADEAIRASARRLDEHLKASTVVDACRPTVVEGERVDQRLVEVARERDALAVVVGRTQARLGLPMLGEVARRLVRRLEYPTVVVPHDFKARSAGAGNVLLLTDLTDGSIAAAQYARDFASATGRGVTSLHIAKPPGVWARPADGNGNGQRRSWDSVHSELHARHRAWLDEHRVAAELVETAKGDRVMHLDRHADGGACVAVCGTRRATGVDRWLHGSFGELISSVASIPCVLVPPEAMWATS